MPATISYSITASDQRSEPTLTSPESSRSGDAYGTLPNSLRVSFRESESALAMPKSSTRTSPWLSIRMFFGLISPCTTAIVFAADRYLQVVGALQRVGHGHRHLGRKFDFELAAPHQFGQVLPVDVLHGHEEVVVQVARVVDPHHARIHCRQVRLQHRPAAFRCDGVIRIGIRAVFDQLQSYQVTQCRILRQVHIGHPAAAEFLADLILAEFARSRRDHFFPPALAVARGATASKRKFRSRISAISVPAGSSREFFSITFPISAGLAPSRAAMPAPLFR